MVFKIKVLKGFGIKGSQVKGTRGLLFKTKKEATSFTKKVGGVVVKKTRKLV